MKGILFIISGPSGVGKGTVIRSLKAKYANFVFPISQTTRAMRPGEKEGDVYNFRSDSDFDAEMQKGNFLETAQVHQKARYGTLKKPIIDALEAGKVVVREVDVQGFHSIAAVVPRQNLVSIFLKAESPAKLLERIAKRGLLPDEELKRRMESAEHEMAAAGEFDFEVWSLEGGVDKLVADVDEIILGAVAKAGLKI